MRKNETKENFDADLILETKSKDDISDDIEILENDIEIERGIESKIVIVIDRELEMNLKLEVTMHV